MPKRGSDSGVDIGGADLLIDSSTDTTDEEYIEDEVLTDEEVVGESLEEHKGAAYLDHPKGSVKLEHLENRIRSLLEQMVQDYDEDSTHFAQDALFDGGITVKGAISVALDSIFSADLDVSGDLGVGGDLTVTGKGTFGKEVIVTTYDQPYSQFRAIGGNYGFMIRNDGTNTYFLLTDSTDQYGTFNSLRPLYIDNATGYLTSQGDVTISKSLPWLTLDSPISGDASSEQGAVISLGESGKGGSAALHISYRGDGYGFIGMGSLSPSQMKSTYNALYFYYTSTNTYFNGNAILNNNMLYLDNSNTYIGIYSGNSPKINFGGDAYLYFFSSGTTYAPGIALKKIYLNAHDGSAIGSTYGYHACHSGVDYAFEWTTSGGAWRHCGLRGTGW